MARFQITGPDGNSYEVTAPDDASDDDVLSYVQQNVGAGDAPQEQAGAAQSGPLDGIDFSRPIEDLRQTIAGLPEDQRKQALDKWADAETARVAKVAGVPTPSPLRGAGFGSFLDEASAGIDAAANYVTGGRVGTPYDEALALQRARQRATEAAHPVGSTVANVVGGVGTAAATPMVKVMQGASALPTAVNMGVTGGAYGALYGYGEGEGTGDRLQKATQGLATGAAVGAPLGAAVGKIVSRGAPGATDDIAAAAEKVGVNLPRVATSGDVAQGVAGALKNIPVVGSPLVTASRESVEQIGAAGDRIAEKFAQGTSPKAAGDAASDALAGWIKGDSAKTMARLHREVEKHIPSGSFSPLRATQQVFDKLGVEDIRAASTVNKPATDMVEAALKKPGGLSFEGLRALRTNVGAMLDDHMLPMAGTTKPALKRLYGALTQDLDSMAWQFGGAKGADAWAKANRIDKMISDRREALVKIIGKDGQKAGESVVDTLLRMAGTNSTADAGKVLLARKAVGSEAWDGVAAEAIHRLGRNQSDDFSPAIFLKKYSALSDAPIRPGVPSPKDLLFGSTGKGSLKDELDALAKVSSKLKSLEAMGNPSGTGRVTSLMTMFGPSTLSALAAGGPAGLLVLIGQAIGGNVLARHMAKPVQVKQITKFADAVYRAATSQNGKAILQPAIASLARTIAEESGESEQEAAARINSALRGQ
jgi:hypothetical protein